jgi:ABC transport system ATP-binding/permease protein
VVDHLFVFHGQADIQDYPGNYTQYRAWEEEHNANKPEDKKTKEIKTKKVRLNDKRRKTFKERREFEILEKEISQLEDEKKSIEAVLSSGTLSAVEITENSKRYNEVNSLLDDKGMRWLELGEIDD